MGEKTPAGANQFLGYTLRAHLPFPIKARGVCLRKAAPGGLDCVRGVAWSIQWLNLWLHVGSLLPLEQKTICEEFWL